MVGFEFYNMNPEGDFTGDCVTRAISLATQQPYSTIRRKLFHTARLLNCEKLCQSCYCFLIEEVYKGKRVNCDYMTVDEFCRKNPYGVYLVRMDYHITCILNGVINDIWDCSNEICTDAWEIK